jgi:hypothetical protein
MIEYSVLETMTTREITDLFDAMERDRARRERAARRDRGEEYETTSALAMAHAREEEEHG